MFFRCGASSTAGCGERPRTRSPDFSTPEPRLIQRGKFVAYYRLSTDKQGKSGLGLDAQREAVLDYLDGGRWELLEEFTELESGKKGDRPELKKAIAQRSTGRTW